MRSRKRVGFPLFSITQSPNHPITGFTFIELIFVTVVLGLLLAAAIPRMQQGWVSFQTEQAAFELAQTLRVARVVAITQSQPVIWTWDAQTRQVALGGPTQDDTITPLAGRAGRPYRVASPISLTIKSEGAPNSRLQCFPDGTCDAASIVLSNRTASRYCVTVDGSTGRVVVQRTALASSCS